MSTWFDEAVACPACGLEQIAKLARGIHVARAPEAREQVFDRSFHRVVCKQCNTRFVAKRPLIYTDMDRKHWVHVAMPHEEPRWRDLERVAVDVFDGAFVGSPLAAALRDGFRVRLVFGMEELREKLVIWRAGFDDATLECAKLQMISRDPALATADKLLVEQIGERGAELVLLDSNESPLGMTTIPRHLLEAQRDDVDRLRRYLPELFGGGFVSWRRMSGPSSGAASSG